MIFGADIRRQRALSVGALAIMVVVLLFPLAGRAERDSTAPRWDLSELLAGMRQVRAASAHFVERKYLQIVSTPLQSSGTLRYVAPDWLEKQTFLPQPSRLTIAGGQVTVEREGETSRIILLQDQPEIGALVAGIRATMAGDLATLTQFYTPSLQGNATNWQLRLEPRDRRIRELVTAIIIKGRWNGLTSVETQESDGDRTEMTIDADSK